MFWLISISFLLRVIGLALALVLWRRLRDRRMAALALLMGLLTIRQGVNCYTIVASPATPALSHWFEEFLALGVSVVGALALAFVSRIISEYKTKEREVTDAARLYRTIFQTTGTATIIVEEDTTIALANTEFEKLSGCPRAEIEGQRHWTEFFAPDSAAKMLDYHRLRRDYAYAAPRSYETRVINRAGQLKEVIATV